MIRAIPFEIAILLLVIFGVYKILKLYAERDQAREERDRALLAEREMAAKLTDMVETVLASEKAKPQSNHTRPRGAA